METIVPLPILVSIGWRHTAGAGCQAERCLHQEQSPVDAVPWSLARLPSHVVSAALINNGHAMCTVRVLSRAACMQSGSHHGLMPQAHLRAKELHGVAASR